MAEVMVRAWSEATKAATFPTSASVAVRFSRAACSIPATIASRPSTVSGIVSGTPPVFRVTNRTPCGPSRRPVAGEGSPRSPRGRRRGRRELSPPCLGPQCLGHNAWGHAKGRRPSRSALVLPCDPRADPLTDRARLSRFPPLSYQPAGAVACAGVILREVSRTGRAAARERHPELVGRGPGLNQPGQAAASGDLRLGDQVGHVRLDRAG